MIQSLYKKFNNWGATGRIWIYSDCHFCGGMFGLDRDNREMRRYFEYADNETQIENINKKVYKSDTLILLGDLGNPDMIPLLNAKQKILIKGNHDLGNNNYTCYFQEIYEGPLFIAKNILLSHEPIWSDLWFNFCGHLHNNWQIENNPMHYNYYCCSANLNNYQPVCLDDFIKHTGQFQGFDGLKNIKDIHRATIDRATEKKKRKNNIWNIIMSTVLTNLRKIKK